jgi:hypothetical protein
LEVLTTEEDLLPFIKAKKKLWMLEAREEIDSLVRGEIMVDKACQPELISLIIPPVVPLA